MEECEEKKPVTNEFFESMLKVILLLEDLLECLSLLTQKTFHMKPICPNDITVIDNKQHSEFVLIVLIHLKNNFLLSCKLMAYILIKQTARNGMRYIS